MNELKGALSRVKMSKTSKLGTLSWSLQARDTCAGSIGANGELVDACKGCYASFGNYRFKTVKAPREHNKQDWKRATWVQDMVTICRTQSHVRLFDSGDMYSVALARKWLDVFKACADTKFWLPTRMHKFPKFKTILDIMGALPNVSVRYSSDSVLGEYERGLHGSVIFPAGTVPPKGTFECGAYKRGGQCGDCRACYDKGVSVIAYPTHGREMAAVVRRLAA